MNACDPVDNVDIRMLFLHCHPTVISSTAIVLQKDVIFKILFKKIFNVYLFLRERQRERDSV